jgi:transcriptional regulator with XRE-family HTH domain
MTNEQPSERLGRLVRERRNELKLTQADVQEAGGPSTATLRLIESGEHTAFRRSTTAPLERILRWGRGAVEVILAGGDPFPDDGELPLIPHATTTDLHEISDGALVAELIDRLAQRHRVLPGGVVIPWKQPQNGGFPDGWIPSSDEPGVLGDQDSEQRDKRRG